MEKVLVTGGAGYIGSHACKALKKAGYLPVSYDNLCTGNRFAVSWGPFEYGDLLDRSRLDQVLSAHKPMAVMHFAAHAYVGESFADPGKYYRNNVMGCVSLLEACAHTGIDRFVFSSSCATYGIPEVSPVTERTPTQPVNPYGRSKLMAETVLSDFADRHGIAAIALRYFNAAGADPDLETGEWHHPETRIIPLALDAAAGRSSAFQIFGDDYDTPDGTCIRDYVHVTDLAEAHVLALERLGNTSLPRTLNLGTGEGVSVSEILSQVGRVTGTDVQNVVADRRLGDPPILIADASLAAAALHWTPRYSAIEKIVETAWKWREKMFVASRG